MIVILFLLALGFGLPAWADGGAAAPSHEVIAARNLVRQGDLPAAENLLKRALRDNPRDLDARILLGQVALRQDDGVGAERWFQSALQQGGQRDQLMPLLGSAYLMQGKAAQILSDLRTDGLAPNLAAEIAVIRARAEIIAKHPTEAAKEANDALALSPEMPDALLTLAQLQRQRGDNQAAALLIDRALAAAPDNVPALDAQGDARGGAGDAQGALDAFTKATSLQPSDQTARLGEARSLISLGKFDLAQTAIDDVLKRRPGQPVALYLRALILEHAGRYTDALSVLEPAAPALVDQLAPQILLGELTLRANQPAKAEGYAQHALSLAPTSISAKLLLAVIFDKENQPFKAVQLLEPVVAMMPTDQQAQMILGDAYARLGRPQLAVKALTAAYHQAPADGVLRARLDASRMRAGDVDGGVKDLTALLAADPQVGSARLLLIAAAIGRGQLDDALALATTQHALQPTDAKINVLLGRLHWMRGDWAAAQQDFQAAVQEQPDDIEAINGLILMRQVNAVPDQADQLYQAAIAHNAADSEAMIALADRAQAGGDIESAAAWLEKASAAAPESLVSRILLVELLLAHQKTQKALTLALALDRGFHDSAQVVLLLARAQLAAGQQDSAVASLHHVAELNPDAALGQIDLAQRLVRLGLTAEALRADQNAIGLSPNNLQAWRSLIVHQAIIAGMPASLQSVKLALKVESIAPYGDALRGAAYLAAKQYPEAENAFRAALKRAPQSWLLLQLAQALSQAGNGAGAIAALADWLKHHPDDMSVRAVYAVALMNNKDNSAAIAEFKTLLAANPTNVALLNNLAWLQSSGDVTAALAHANLAFALDPQSPQVRDTLAWVFLQKNDTATATTLLRMAHKTWPDNPDIAYHLALAAARTGDLATARALIQPLTQSNAVFASRDEAKQLSQTLATTQK